MKLLGIETSTERGSLALVEEGRVVSLGAIDTHLKHSARLLPVLDDLLRHAGWKVNDLTAVAVGLGPGSFTGIRVGLAVAQGLAFGLGIPLKGIGSFEALVRGSGWKEGEVEVVADARRGRVYLARYRIAPDGVTEIEPPRCLAVVAAGRCLKVGQCIGPHWDRLRDTFGPGPGNELRAEGKLAWPEASWVALIAGEKLRIDPRDERETAVPIYLSEFKHPSSVKSG